MTGLLLLLQAPPIPSGITDQGLLLAAFVVAVVPFLTIYLVAKGYLRIGKNGGHGTAEDRAAVLAALVAQTAALGELTAAIRAREKEAEAAIRALEKELMGGLRAIEKEETAVRRHFHDLTQVIAGLSYAYLLMAHQDSLAADVLAKNPELQRPGRP